MASSEEIAAALNRAANIVEWSAAERRPREPREADEDDRAARILRAHLSRLREEAAFVRLAKVWCATYDRQHAMALPSDEHADMMSAYRALEEPRDAPR